MRKGKDHLTYKQLFDENKKLKLQIGKMEEQIKKLELDLHSRTVAHNKLLEKVRNG